MLLRMELSLPREARFVAILRNVTQCVLVDLGVPQTDSDDIQLALTEACANAVRHAVGSGEYSVMLRLGEESCEVEISDLGPGFAAPDVAAPVTDAQTDAESGRGLQLIRALVDDLQFIREDDATRVRLTKRFNGLGLVSV